VSWAIWITGPPGSGKTAVARATTALLAERGCRIAWLELDQIRQAITPAPRYSDREREIVYRALGYMAVTLVEAATPVLIDATAHRRIWRDRVRAAVPRFAEVQLVCPLEICRRREEDRAPGHAPRGIYRRSGRAGATVPGVDVPYEPALAPDLLIDTDRQSVDEAAERVARLAGKLAAAARVPPPTDDRAPRPEGRLLGPAAAERLLLGDRPVDDAERELVHRVLAHTATLLAEAGVAVAGSPARA
jgi:adenylylsulfate kinase